jgi:acyl carrier protein
MGCKPQWCSRQYKLPGGRLLSVLPAQGDIFPGTVFAQSLLRMFFNIEREREEHMPTSFALVQDALTSLGVAAAEITPDASLLNDLSIDSTEMIEVITIIERKIGISLDEKQLKNVRTVTELASFVENSGKQVAD